MLCCIPRSRGRSPRKPCAERLVQCFRRWFSPRPRPLWPSGRRSPKSEDTSSLSSDATHMVWPVPARTLKKRVEHLVPAVLGGDQSYVHLFLSSYKNFASPRHVLHLLFLRYGNMISDCDGDGESLEHLKCAMSSVLKIWLEFYSTDFHEPPEFHSLKFLSAYVHISMRGSEVERKADLLLAQLEKPEHLEPSEAETEGEEEEVPASAQAEQLSQELLPCSARVPAPAPPPLPEAEREQDPEPKPEQEVEQEQDPEQEVEQEQDPEQVVDQTQDPEQEQQKDQEKDQEKEQEKEQEKDQDPEVELEQPDITVPETSEELEETPAPRGALAPELPQTPSPVPTPDLFLPFLDAVLLLIFVCVLHLLKFFHLLFSIISLV